VDGSVFIEPYCKKWQDAIFELILPIQREEFGVEITAADQPDLGNIPEYYQHGRGQFWVAVVGGEVVGSVALLDIGEGGVALRKMFVKKEYRGKERKVAASLLSTALDWAREKAVRNIYLGTTSKYHAAHRFYEKNGFARIEKEALPPSFPVMEVDTIFYIMAFPQSE
jgi:N-acetylglutamate synthase-like GNAT family acetyltransferase